MPASLPHSDLLIRPSRNVATDAVG